MLERMCVYVFVYVCDGSINQVKIWYTSKVVVVVILVKMYAV